MSASTNPKLVIGNFPKRHIGNSEELYKRNHPNPATRAATFATLKGLATYKRTEDRDCEYTMMPNPMAIALLNLAAGFDTRAINVNCHLDKLSAYPLYDDYLRYRGLHSVHNPDDLVKFILLDLEDPGYFDLEGSDYRENPKAETHMSEILNGYAVHSEELDAAISSYRVLGKIDSIIGDSAKRTLSDGALLTQIARVKRVVDRVNAIPEYVYLSSETAGSILGIQTSFGDVIDYLTKFGLTINEVIVAEANK